MVKEAILVVEDKGKVCAKLLTPQEKRILCLLEKGYTNKEIAKTLGLMLSTVRTYNYVLYQKLAVKNRTQAIMVAKEARFI